MTTKKEQEDLEASLKYGSGPVVIRQGSVPAEFFDKYGVGPAVVDDPEVSANHNKSATAAKKES